MLLKASRSKVAVAISYPVTPYLLTLASKHTVAAGLLTEFDS